MTYPTHLPVNRIHAGPNPRRFFDKAKEQELIDSVRTRGILMPILVRPSGDGFEIVAGERRWRAAREAHGPEYEMPVSVRELSDSVARAAALAENSVRDDMSATEEGNAAARFLADMNGDRAAAAAELGWSKAKLDRRLALCKLAEPVRLALDERRILVGHAELLAAVPAEKQPIALDRVLKAKLSVDKTRDLLMATAHNLAIATFDKAECLGCQYNSGVQRALFETSIGEDGFCSNPPCYDMKVESADKAKAEAAAEEARVQAKAVEAANNAAADLAPAVDDNETDQSGPGVGPTPAASSVAKAATSVTRQATTTTAPALLSSPDAARKAAKDARELQWRKTVANALVNGPDIAQTVILTAAFDGTLNQIGRETLPLKSDRIFGAGYSRTSISERFNTMDMLPVEDRRRAFGAIAGCYAMNVAEFAVVAAIAKRWAFDIRDDWTVDRKFLELFTKPTLKEIAVETGLSSHLGEKQFTRIYGAKREDLIAGMLGAAGFVWAGRLPSSMSLDGGYHHRPVHRTAKVADGTFSGPGPDVATATTADTRALEPAD